MNPIASATATLRPRDQADEGFLLALYASTRAGELDQVGWAPGEREAFVAMQFAAQDAEYRRANPSGRFDIIEVDGVRAGRLYLDRRPNQLRVVDLALLPAYRNRGIGTALLKELQASAATDEMCLTVHVEATNRAARLYERLGFAVVADLGVYRLLEWRP